MLKILFLGYSKKETRLIHFLKSQKNIKLTCSKRIVNKEYIQNFDFVICFGYRHIIDKAVLKNNEIPIINLHISYLPYNKGAHPNFWSFVDNTPSGITIHEINEKVDSGKIIYQKIIDFNLLENINNLTFSNTHAKLVDEIENLFIDKFDNLISRKYSTFDQIGEGSFHKKNDLPRNILRNWKQNVFKTVKKYDDYKKKIMQKNLDIIDQIENTRRKNNINWMNIVRTALSSSSQETLKILKQINTDDSRISSLFKKFNDNK